MIAVLLACGIATAFLFLISFYFPVMKEIKIEENLNIKNIINYSAIYTILYVFLAIIWNTVTFPAMLFVMFVKHEEFKEMLKESTRKRILEAV